QQQYSASQFRRRENFFKTALPYALIAGAVGLLFVLTAFAWYSRDLPRPDKIIDRSVAQSTKIFDRSGEHLLFEVYGAENRTLIKLEDIPEFVKWATILVEDKKFYEHKGFDLRGMARALIIDVLTVSTAQGGSTLTQQLIKNALLSNEKVLSRKVKELVLAYQIERKFSKDQILQMYFNEIPYGSTAYGLQSASQYYFKKDAKDLTVAEGAALVALAKATTYYSPYGPNRDKLLSRKDYVIGLLEQDGKITEDQAKEARSAELVFAERTNTLLAPHFVIDVREQLAKEYGQKTMEEGGLKVITTIDYDLQQAAEEAISFYAEQNEKKYGAKNEALAAIDPKTGQVLALVGSRDYFEVENDGNFNVATMGQRQPGSSFKPFVYAAGFEKGYTDKTTLWDVVTNFGKGGGPKDYQPRNYDLKERGPISARSALAMSLNVPAVKMLYLVGPETVINKAREFGYTTFEDPSRYGLALVLGGAEVKLIEHTAAFAALAAEGVKREIVTILKVEDSRGQVMQEKKDTKEERVMDAEIVRELTDILSDNAARTPMFGANNFLTLGNRPAAAKTGTTNDYRDAWTMGYTPQLAAGVWVGNNDFSAMGRGADGSVVAAPIWNRFMRNALAKKPVESFTKPNITYPEKPALRGDLEKGALIKIDRASGLLATALTPPGFIEEQIFAIGHNILHYVKRDDPLGPEPTESERDVQYASWEKAVQEWIKKNKWNASGAVPPTESDNVHLPENKPSITITAPVENETIKSLPLNFAVTAEARRGLTRVDFYLDDILLGSSREAPHVFSYNPAEITNGFHTLKAMAWDDIDNSETVQVTFNLFLEK
ncbi:MAG: hypothetical protein A3H70_04955, partial [Candidatus Komeilibacteria bacterium RIFCSPLOWO2_02_FULL_48_11]